MKNNKKRHAKNNEACYLLNEAQIILSKKKRQKKERKKTGHAIFIGYRWKKKIFLTLKNILYKILHFQIM